MADNIQITQGTGTTLRTTDNAGVHIPHHIVQSSALPAGAATEATLSAAADRIGNTTDAEATGNGSLVGILKRIRTLLAGTLTVALPTGAATAANQTATNTALGSIDTSIDAVGSAVEDVITAVNTQGGAILEAVTKQSSFVFLAAVTPNDDADLTNGACNGLVVTASGNVVIRASAHTSGSHTIPVVAGMILPIATRRVLATGTTATVLAGYTTDPT